MRIGEQPGAQARLRQNGRDHGGGGTLALGARDQHRREGPVRVAEFVQEGGEGVQVEMLRGVRDPLAGFVIDELRQVGQGLLVGQHCAPSP